VQISLGLATTASQARITLIKKKADLKSSKKEGKDIKSNKEIKRERKEREKDIKYLLKTFNNQLAVYYERFFVQKVTIWLAIGGCFSLLLSGFFLDITPYATVLYWVEVVFLYIGIILLLLSSLCGFYEVGMIHRSDKLLIDYLQEKEKKVLQYDHSDEIERENEKKK